MYKINSSLLINDYSEYIKINVNCKCGFEIKEIIDPIEFTSNNIKCPNCERQYKIYNQLKVEQITDWRK